jgi:hypothetical protein
MLSYNKQSCPFLPILFNFYINDLVTGNFKESGIGVKFNDDIISILLYADDVVLIA